MEPRQLGRPSSLDFFARLDISLWEYQEGKFHYYVNEVTRGVTAVLYGLFGEDVGFFDRVDKMVQAFGPYIERMGTVSWDGVDHRWMAELDRVFE